MPGPCRTSAFLQKACYHPAPPSSRGRRPNTQASFLPSPHNKSPHLLTAERGFYISKDPVCFLSQSAGGPAAFFAGAAVAFYVDVVGMTFGAFRGVIYRFHCYYVRFFLTVLFFAFRFSFFSISFLSSSPTPRMLPRRQPSRKTVMPLQPLSQAVR